MATDRKPIIALNVRRREGWGDATDKGQTQYLNINVDVVTLMLPSGGVYRLEIEDGCVVVNRISDDAREQCADPVRDAERIERLW